MKRHWLAFVYFAIGVCALAALAPGNVRGAVLLTDVVAKDVLGKTYSAKTALGLFEGNDTGNSAAGLVLLNNGGLGAEFDDIEWTYAGKFEASALNPFTTSTVEEMTSGTLTFEEVYSGAFAISLKAGNNHAIYVFEELSNVVSVTFTTQAFANANGKAKALSHASLFLGESRLPSVEPVPVSTPEPTTFAIFALGAATLGLSQLRRRVI
jgi:hypothetical protein